MRPIDADALKESARGISVFRTYDAGMPDLRALVDAALTLDYAPVKHGRWILNEDGKWACSDCDGVAIEHPENPNTWQALTACCPHCGAKMDEGKRDG